MWTTNHNAVITASMCSTPRLFQWCMQQYHMFCNQTSVCSNVNNMTASPFYVDCEATSDILQRPLSCKYCSRLAACVGRLSSLKQLASTLRIPHKCAGHNAANTPSSHTDYCSSLFSSYADNRWQSVLDNLSLHFHAHTRAIHKHRQRKVPIFYHY